VRIRRVYLVAVAAGLLGAAVSVLPGLAAGASPPSSASFTAVDPYSWQAGNGTNTVTIAQGGTVSFSYPSGSNTHNADFYTAFKPTSCAETNPNPNDAVPPLPSAPSGPGWTGTCTFNTPGTYTFYCDHHLFLMTGTIVVQAPGGTTTGTTSTTTGSTTTTTTPPTTTGTTQAPAPPSPAAASIAVVRRQRGRRITGSVEIPRTYAGASLEVVVFASVKSLGRHGRGRVRLGRLLRTPLAPGTDRFAVKLRGLRRGRPVELTVTVAVTAPGGASKSSRFTVLLQP
jgi:plastocyanin